MQKSINVQKFIIIFLIFTITNNLFSGAIDRYKVEKVKWNVPQERIVMQMLSFIPRNIITIPKIIQAPKLDGKSDDECWQQATLIDFFTATRGHDVKPQLRWGVDPTREKFEVKLCYDDKYLYVAMIAEEPLVGLVHPIMSKHDQAIWKDDCFEFFFDTNLNRTTDYHSIVNIAGAYFDSEDSCDKKIKTKGRSFDWKDAKFAVRKDIKNGYVYIEARFDFASVGGRPKLGSSWGMNLAWQRRVSGFEGVKNYRSWNGYPNGFSKTTKYHGNMVFGNVALHAEKFSAPFIGKNEFACSINSHDSDMKLKAYVEVINQAGVKDKSTEITFKASKGKALNIKLPFLVKGEGVQYAMLCIKDESGNTLMRLRRPFYIEPVQTKLQESWGKVITNLDKLQERSSNQKFTESINKIFNTAKTLKQRIQKFYSAAVKSGDTETKRKKWNSFMDEVNTVMSMGSLIVWTKNPHLKASPESFPDSLTDIKQLDLRGCKNEYVSSTVMLSNLTDQNLVTILRTKGVVGWGSPFDKVEVLTTPAVSSATILDNNPAALDYSLTRGFNLPKDTGEPLYRVSGLGEIVVPPLSSRQVFLIFHINKKVRINRNADFKNFNKGLLQFWTLNKAMTPKNIKLNVRVDNFEIPTVAALGVYFWEYANTKKFNDNQFEHKINTWFASDGLTKEWNFGLKKFAAVKGNNKSSLRRIVSEAKRTRDYPGTKRGWAYGHFAKLAKLGPKLGGYMSETHKEYIKAHFKQYVKLLNEQGIKSEDIVISTIDEAKGKEIDKIVDIGRLVKEAIPGIRLALTTQIRGKDRDKLDGIIDFWLPAGGYIWEKGRKHSEGTFWGPALGFYDKQKDKGAIIYPYQCSVPVRGQCPIGYFRMYGWRAFDTGVDGIAVFSGGSNVYNHLNSFGDIPGNRGWEAFRDGVEDWQYCNRLKKEIERIEKTHPALAKKSWQEISKIFRSIIKHGGPNPKDSPELAKKIEYGRIQIANMILRLKKVK